MYNSVITAKYKVHYVSYYFINIFVKRKPEYLLFCMYILLVRIVFNAHSDFSNVKKIIIHNNIFF